MPYAKLESGSFAIFGDMMSQDFTMKKGTSHQIPVFTPGNGFHFYRISFYVQNRSSQSKTDLHVNFSNFQAEENFFIFLKNF